MKVFTINSETSYILDPVSPRMSPKDISSLIYKYKNSSRRRHRYCFHQNPKVDLHDIIICYDSKTYIPPNKHIGKVESLTILSGTIDFFLFNDSGIVYDYRRLSSFKSGKPFYVRVPPNVWHGLRVVGDEPVIIKETISGPYDPLTLKWANFAPAENANNENGFKWYDDIFNECRDRKIKIDSEEIFEKINDTVFRSNQQLVTVSLAQLEPIIEAAKKSNLKRARLCCHLGIEEKLQEMFIVLVKDVDIEESIHIKKDESLSVIHGQGHYVFFNEDGSLRENIKLSKFNIDLNSSEESFFVRINRYISHKIKVDSDYMLIHEATTGPFLKFDTDYKILRIDQ